MLARARSVVRSPHARTKLPAVTIIISSSATAEFDRGSIFGRAGKMTRSLARGRTTEKSCEIIQQNWRREEMLLRDEWLEMGP